MAQDPKQRQMDRAPRREPPKADKPERSSPLPLAERRRLVQPMMKPGSAGQVFHDWALI